MATKLPGRQRIHTDRIVLVIDSTVTLAELNAGKTLIIPRSQSLLRVIDYQLIMNGAFTTLTDMRLSSLDPAGLATPTDVLTVVAAQMGDAVVHSFGVGTHTRGAGFGVDLPASHGLQIRKTGGTAAGGTDIKVRVFYRIMNS